MKKIKLAKETTENNKNVMEKPLGIGSSVLYGIGCGIGGSIFLLLGNAIEIAGPGVLISLALGGILIFLTALNYSELSISLPLSGGAYNFSKQGLGGFLAFIIGLFLWIANIGTIVFSSLSFALVIFQIFPAMESIKTIIALLSILFISIVVFRTQKIALKSLLLLTIVLISIFTFFTFSGIFISPKTNPANYNPSYIFSDFNFFAIMQTFSLLFICFNSITSNLAYLNPQIKNRLKNIPRINTLAITSSTLIYLIITSVVLINIGGQPDSFSNEPILLAGVLKGTLGDFGFYIMGIAAIISTLIAMNAALGSAISVLYALARDNYITAKLRKVDKKRNVPIYSLIVTTIISIIIVLLVDIELAALMTSFIYFFGLAFVNFAAVSLRYKRKELARPFKAPFFPYLPCIVGSTCLILAFSLIFNGGAEAILIGIIIFLVGLLYYLLTIADRPSILLTIAGLKFFSVIIIGIFIWILKNLSVMSSTLSIGIEIFDLILLRILIIIVIFVLITVIFDIIPLREIVYSFVKRIDKQKVAITIGEGRIIELEKKHTRLIYYINLIMGVILLVSAIFIFILAILVNTDIINIENIGIGGTHISKSGSEFIFTTVLSIFGIILIFSSAVQIYFNRELKNL
ncbi:MAG: amino acid permease [Candidatus Lokiarchaeota archaeon]|nr:amino acid permease [Candidatus Lokiarchaeota archaeon]